MSLRSSDNIVWHHPTCPTNYNKLFEWSPDSVWDHRVRQHSSYHRSTSRSSLGATRESVINSHCSVNPAFIPSSPENSIHYIFPTILVILSASWASVTCFWLWVGYTIVWRGIHECNKCTPPSSILFYITLQYINTSSGWLLQLTFCSLVLDHETCMFWHRVLTKTCWIWTGIWQYLMRTEQETCHHMHMYDM